MLCRGFSVHADRKPPSRAALLKYVKIATSLKDPALLAMKDVTYLSNREKGHSDFTTFGNARAHVTLKMLVRPGFQQATKIQQEEVYILRLARQVPNREDCGMIMVVRVFVLISSYIVAVSYIHRYYYRRRTTCLHSSD